MNECNRRCNSKVTLHIHVVKLSSSEPVTIRPQKLVPNPKSKNPNPKLIIQNSLRRICLGRIVLLPSCTRLEQSNEKLSVQDLVSW